MTNIIDFGQDFKTAIDSPSLHLSKFGVGGQPAQQVFAGEFSDELIDGAKNMGLRMEVVPNNMKSTAPRGYVDGASINPVSGERQAVGSKILNARALGQK